MTARERFEAWMRKHNVDSQAVLWRDEHFPDCYHYGATEAAWQAWQAAEAAERERCASLCENWPTPDCGGWTLDGLSDAIRAGA